MLFFLLKCSLGCLCFLMKHTSFIALLYCLETMTRETREHGSVLMWILFLLNIFNPWLVESVTPVSLSLSPTLWFRVWPCFLKTQKYRQFFSQRKSYSTYWQRKEIYILRNTFRLVASEVTPTEVWCIRSRPAESQLYLPVHLFTLQNDFMSEVAHSGTSSSPTSSPSTSRPSTMLVTQLFVVWISEHIREGPVPCMLR